MMQHQPKRARVIRILNMVGFATAVLAFAAGILAGLGHRWGWWTFTSGFAILRWASYAAVGAAVISLVGAVPAYKRRYMRGLSFAVLGCLIGAATASVPAYWLHRARQVPRIHDITTDTADPPQFNAILPLRANAPNSAKYGGLAVAIQQQAAYPDIQTLLLPSDTSRTFDQALALVRDNGWAVAAAQSDEGRIEATTMTLWFGFKDDVVIRIRAMDGGSRVDMRSVSREGVSDVGTNARRIRHFLRSMRKASS